MNAMKLAPTYGNGIRDVRVKRMTIACLGWGSLVWNPDSLILASEWRTDGPAIPVEFARQSNNGRMTLVITPGAPDVTVLWATLAVDDIEKAKAELALREGITPRNIPSGIGYWTQAGASRGPEGVAIGTWARALGHDGVVWTACGPGFRASTEPQAKLRSSHILPVSQERHGPTPRDIVGALQPKYALRIAPP
jgi:hypothetical protein